MRRAARFLVVDDDEDLLVLLAGILADLGHEVSFAGDGASALRQLTADPPDVLVLDLVMPGLDGWSVLRQLRSRSDPPAVVVLSAYLDSLSSAHAAHMGVVACVRKPFDLRELQGACERALS